MVHKETFWLPTKKFGSKSQEESNKKLKEIHFKLITMALKIFVKKQFQLYCIILNSLEILVK